MSDFIDKAKHKAEEVAGEAKAQIGEATGDDELRGEGTAQKAKGNAHQAADTVSDVVDDAVDTVSDVADSAVESASSIADTAAATASDAADKVTDLADTAVSKARDIDVDTVVDTAKSPRTLVIASALAGVGVVAVLLNRRNRRRRVRNAFIAPRVGRSKSLFGR